MRKKKGESDLTLKPKNPVWVLLVVLVSVLIAVAFAASFWAMYEMALLAGTHPGLAWWLPVLIDGTIIVTIFGGAEMSKRSGKNKWFVWLVFGFCTVMSMVLNGIHSGINHDPDSGFAPGFTVIIGMLPPTLMLMLTRVLELATIGASQSSDAADGAEAVTSLDVEAAGPAHADSVTSLRDADLVTDLATAARADAVIDGVTQPQSSQAVSHHDVTDHITSNPVIDETSVSSALTDSRDFTRDFGGITPKSGSVMSPAVIESHADDSGSSPHVTDAELMTNVSHDGDGVTLLPHEAPVTEAPLAVMTPPDQAGRHSHEAEDDVAAAPAVMTSVPRLHAVITIPDDAEGQVTWIASRARAGHDVTKKTLLQVFADAGLDVSDSTMQRRLRAAKDLDPEAFAAA
ncbi:DUF2637 domain-containing protein [Microbacterium sp.]|uniref:DUF2637 domain-containing protein n=1 Tax=Microbacterium sp. TaxID=51671 RepID=UPI003342E25F